MATWICRNCRTLLSFIDAMQLSTVMMMMLLTMVAVVFVTSKEIAPAVEVTVDDDGGDVRHDDDEPRLASTDLRIVQNHETKRYVNQRRMQRQITNQDAGKAQNGSVDTTNATVVLVAELGNNETTKGISDKVIVLIVVCSSLLLVVCLVGAALMANRFQCGKIRRDDNSHYQVVLPRDCSANSPLEEQPTTALSNRDNDAHGHTNLFAQIDEIDEADSCPSSPHNNHRHIRRISQEASEIEVKPLLVYSEVTPTSRNKVIGESDDIGDASDSGRSKVELPDTDVVPSIAEIRVEIVPAYGRDSRSRRRSSDDTHQESSSVLYGRTGLSQSDYSLSSFTSVNPSYHYGNQVGYMSGYYGYPDLCAFVPSCNYLADDDGGGDEDYDDGMLMRLLPPSAASYHGIFPSQESDLDISVRAAKDSNSDDAITIDGTSQVGDGAGLIGNPLSSNLMALDSGSDPSLDRLAEIVADDDDDGDPRPTSADDFDLLELEEDTNKIMKNISGDDSASNSYVHKLVTEDVDDDILVLPSNSSQSTMATPKEDNDGISITITSDNENTVIDTGTE